MMLRNKFFSIHIKNRDKNLKKIRMETIRIFSLFLSADMITIKLKTPKKILSNPSGRFAVRLNKF